jgi:hypothetical protein
MIANGLPIPEALIALIQSWRWPTRCEEFLFSEECVRAFAPDESRLCLYPAFGKPEVSVGDLASYLGVPDVDKPPGDIDFTRAVIIGDFGLGSDTFIALDYRTSLTSPSVIRYHWPSVWPPDNKNNRWVFVVGSVEEFAELIGL